MYCFGNARKKPFLCAIFSWYIILFVQRVAISIMSRDNLSFSCLCAVGNNAMYTGVPLHSIVYAHHGPKLSVCE